MPKLNEYTNSLKTVPEEYEKWQKDPSEDNYNNLLKMLNPIISSGMTSYGSPDLGVRARIIVDKALRTYDPSKGASLKTHVYNNLKSLQRYRANRQTAIYTPERSRLDKGHIYEAEKAYHDTHGILPSDETLADMLAISKKRVKNMRYSSGESPELFSEKGDSLVEAPSRTSEDIWLDYVHHDLDDVNKKIFEWTTGYNNTPVIKKADIAKKLGISAPAVSSRIHTITKKIEEGLNDGTRDLR